ncbi:OLC1v1009181C1 [Oldenlandia corymbosa var. corymbosa]|uniref:Splicing factor U2af large subunit n=1 Tax=Oldenlandia corymbosa var. corymbosa TaxID=529605 RepID=A0AAV1DN99_OLDCO|nr:OLC1v1009181C1 [Oldenlandia corymbosa var. corymbosa]
MSSAAASRGNNTGEELENSDVPSPPQSQTGSSSKSSRDGDREHRSHRHRDDGDYHRNKNQDRRRDYCDRPSSWRRHRTRSRDRSSKRRPITPSPPSRSSRSKSARKTLFDMASPELTQPPQAIQFPFQLPVQVSNHNILPLQATRHPRRVYLGGLLASATEASVAAFFSHVISAMGGNSAWPGEAVMSSVEEASNAMALDGIIFEGGPVKVKRPTDYDPIEAASIAPTQPNPNLNLAAVGLNPGSSTGLDGPDRLFVGGLPYNLSEAEIKELLESLGTLRGFDLVRDRETGNSKGYAFCVYHNSSDADIACAYLNGTPMGGRKILTVRRANQGCNQQLKPGQEQAFQQAQQQIAIKMSMFQALATPTKVVCLKDVVNVEELRNDDDYEEIVDDMRAECGKFGTLANLLISRPGPNGELLPGVGRVFLEFADVESAVKARDGLNGRKFGGNPVVAVFYPENKFSGGDYSG